MNEAFVDFTGGVGEVLYLRGHTPGLFSALRNALAKESLVGATALVSVGLRLAAKGWALGSGREHLVFSSWLLLLTHSLSHKPNCSKLGAIYLHS